MTDTTKNEWKPIGMSVQATEDGPPVEVVESLCMQCHEQVSNHTTVELKIRPETVTVADPRSCIQLATRLRSLPTSLRV